MWRSQSAHGIADSEVDLRQTPIDKPKVMLQIFVQTPDTSAPEPQVFQFTSKTSARAEADAFKDFLGKSIQAMKAIVAPLAVPGKTTTSAAMAIANAVSSGPRAGQEATAWSDDMLLRSDERIQKSLLESDPALKNTFLETLRTKPESISTSQLTSQFWSTRTHLLRAHAIEKSQSRGQYNVLSTIRPVMVDDKPLLSVSKEQIQLIFSLHPLVKRIYNENVPQNFTETEFWSIFFVSRIFKKLKGEKVTEDDLTNKHLDKYLSFDEDTERAKRLMAAHIPHIIDVEGNEVNHSQRKGNDGDITMRPSSKVPILRTLNALSEKLMSHVAPNDVDPSLPIRIDEETFNSLALRDLQGDPEENQRTLNIRDQSRFFSSGKEFGSSADALLFAKQNRTQVISTLRAGLRNVGGNQSLETTIGVDPDSDSDDEGGPTQDHVGSRLSIAAATKQMLNAIAQQRDQREDLTASSSGFSTIQMAISTYGLSASVFERLSLTHATTMEFLQQFWSAFLSGDSNRADELATLVETLDRAMDRMKAVADAAETERQPELNRLKQEAREQFKATKKKIMPDLDAVKGGAKVVNQLFAPTIESIDIASRTYRDVLRKQTAESLSMRS